MLSVIYTVGTSLAATNYSGNNKFHQQTLKSIYVGDKAIDLVRIYPNPVSTQLNVTYTLSKESLVTIKILDVLGNEVLTLLSQKASSTGEQTNSFNVSSKLNSGLYFVKIVAGSETIIKRISVL